MESQKLGHQIGQLLGLTLKNTVDVILLGHTTPLSERLFLKFTEFSHF
jgi:hypothetical protein